MEKKTKNKFKSTAFWAALASAFLLFAQNVARLFGYDMPEELVNEIMLTINSFLSLLTIAGILIDKNDVQSYQVVAKKLKKKQ